jgi:hypothetical protein
MVSRSRIVAFSSTSSAAALYPDGAHAALEEASVAAATPRDLLPALAAEAASALRLAQAALGVVVEASVEASVPVAASAVAVAVAAVSAATVPSEEEEEEEEEEASVEAVVVVVAATVAEDTEVAAVLATQGLLMALQPVLVVLVIAAHTAVVTAQAAVLTTAAEGVTVDPAVPTTSPLAAGTDTVTATETVGTEAGMAAEMEAATRARENVGTRVTATTTEASEGGTESSDSSTLRRVCQKVTFPLFALPSLSTRLRTTPLVLSQHRDTHQTHQHWRVSIVMSSLLQTSGFLLLPP